MSQLHEVTFNWPYNAHNVVVTGTFDKWSLSTPMIRTESGFSVKVPVPWGEKVTYKYVVDGRWVTSAEHPTEYDPNGNLNNIYFSPAKPTSPPTIVAPPTPESVKELPLPDEDEVVAPTTTAPVETAEVPLPEPVETLTNPEPTHAETAETVSPPSAVSVEQVEEQTPPAVEKNESALELTVEPTPNADNQAPAPEVAEEIKPEPVYLAGAVKSPAEAVEAPVEAPTEPAATPVPEPVAANHDSTAPTDAATTVVVPSTESTKESAPSTRPSTPPKASFPLVAPDSPSNKATPPTTPKSTVSKAANGKDSMRKKRGSIFGKIMGVFSSPKKDA